MSLADFELIQILGEGSYAKVLKAKFKETGKIVAIKILEKYHIKKVFLY